MIPLPPTRLFCTAAAQLLLHRQLVRVLAHQLTTVFSGIRVLQFVHCQLPAGRRILLNFQVQNVGTNAHTPIPFPFCPAREWIFWVRSSKIFGQQHPDLRRHIVYVQQLQLDVGANRSVGIRRVGNQRNLLEASGSLKVQPAVYVQLALNSSGTISAFL